MKTRAAVMMCMLAMTVICIRQTHKFEVSRTSTNNKQQQSEKVADLSIITDKDYNEASADIQLVYEGLVDLGSLRNPEDRVILIYRNTKTGQEFKQTITSDRLIQSNYKEILSIIVNANYDIIGINYSQQKLKRKELGGIQATIHKSQQAKEYILTYVQAIKLGQEIQEESFFTKYKWYILGFVGVLFLMSKADPEAMQAQMQQRAG